MKKTAAVSSSILLLTFLMSSIVRHASAQTDIQNNVNITSNGGNTESNVNVSSSTNTNISNTSTTTSNGKTHVRIENNGVVKEYDSDSGEDVDMQSDNGNTKVHISNGKTTIATDDKTTAASSSSQLEKVKEQKEHALKQIEKQKEEMHKKIEETKNMIDKQHFDIFKFLKTQFSILGIKLFS